MIYDYGALNIVYGRYQSIALRIFWKSGEKNTDSQKPKHSSSEKGPFHYSPFITILSIVDVLLHIFSLHYVLKLFKHRISTECSFLLLCVQFRRGRFQSWSLYRCWSDKPKIAEYIQWGYCIGTSASTAVQLGIKPEGKVTTIVESAVLFLDSSFLNLILLQHNIC